MFVGSATVFSQDPNTVRVVKPKERVIISRHAQVLRNGRNLCEEGEDAVGQNQRRLTRLQVSTKFLAEVLRVAKSATL